MANISLPIKFEFPSGDVSQWFKSWTSILSPSNNQFGFLNVYLGRSSAPHVEEEVLTEVGSYGKQLGRIGDALVVLLTHFEPKQPLSDEEKNAIEDLKSMLREIADIKKNHDRGSLHP